MVAYAVKESMKEARDYHIRELEKLETRKYTERMDLNAYENLLKQYKQAFKNQMT